MWQSTLKAGVTTQEIDDWVSAMTEKAGLFLHL